MLSDKVREVVQKSVEAYPDKWKTGVCAYDCIDKKKGDCAYNYSRVYKYDRSSKGDICHAGLNYIEPASIVVNAHNRVWQQTSPDFMRWLMREAPFTHGVLNRDNEKEFLNHASVIDMEAVGKGGALWLCKAMRHFTEDTWVPETWTKLRECGLDGLQAFIGADILTQEGSPRVTTTHVSLFGYTSPDRLRKVYDKTRKLKKIEDTNAAQWEGYAYGTKAPNWGGLAFNIEKKKDGWGGFIEVKRPCNAKDYAAKLKEIFTGDPKNVK